MCLLATVDLLELVTVDTQAGVTCWLMEDTAKEEWMLSLLVLV